MAELSIAVLVEDILEQEVTRQEWNVTFSLAHQCFGVTRLWRKSRDRFWSLRVHSALWADGTDTFV